MAAVTEGDRQQPALRIPEPARIDRFPRTVLRPTRQLYRAHRRGNGMWWFCSDLTGRFDLPPPRGTCYLADKAVAALRESLGRLVIAGVVVSDELTARVVSTCNVGGDLTLADTTARRAANHGVTFEIRTVTPFTVPQAWAEAWAAHGFAGVRYHGRFSTDNSRCYALFGNAGPGTGIADPAPRPAAGIAAAAGLRIVTRPRHVTVISPGQ